MDKILIIDFGSQYTHLIARRIRSLGVYSEIYSELSLDKAKEYKGIILSGGPESVYIEGCPTVDKKIFDLGIPVLGICYGHQLMMHLLGGEVVKGDGIGAEFGKAEIEVLENVGILKSFDVKEKNSVWMSHADKVSRLAEGFEIIASSKDDPYSAVANLGKNFFGIQFHPEVVHTERGKEIYSNFLDICEVKRDWSSKHFVDEIIGKIKEEVKDRKVFMLISGGVDSSVAYTLLVKALGQDKVYGYFVDTGLMRKNERLEIEQMFKDSNVSNVHFEDAKEIFLNALNKEKEMPAVEPEEKRKIIGSTFLKVQKNIAERLDLNPKEWMIGQGTIYPDTIESGGTKNSHKIKTHHNRVPEIDELIKQGLIIEPIKDLYKDEVREVGLALGMPEELIWRRPFPGPGLGVRILCNLNNSLKEDNIDEEKLTREVNEFLKIKNLNLKAKVLNIKSVGVQGDFRTYKHPVILYGQSGWKDLADIAPQITNKFSDINRVLYLISPEMSDINEVNVIDGYLSEDRIEKLQQADKIASDWLDKVDLTRQVWQMPVVLLPINLNNKGRESIVLRPFESEEVMTANFAELPMEKVIEVSEEIMKDQDISAVLYDITNKPPATIEWE